MQAYATKLPNGEIHVFPIQYNLLQKRWVNYWKVIDGVESERADPRSWDRLYREACNIRPCVLFLDEADGILRDRSSSGHGMLTEKILVTLDGAGGRTPDVLIIAATNHLERFDAAALRSSRGGALGDIRFPLQTSRQIESGKRETRPRNPRNEAS